MGEADNVPAGGDAEILLVFCAPTQRRMYVNALPPLGVLYLAAYLEGHGVRTDVIDCGIDDPRRVDPGRYRVVGFSINVSNVAASLAWMRAIRRDHPAVRIVVGGPHVSADPAYFLALDCVDAACVDEGEASLLAFVRGETTIPGMHVKTPGGVAYPGPRPPPEDLDALPFPALDKLDLSRYRYYPRRRRPTSSIMTSRGCPFGCAFCFRSTGSRWRKRSARNVVDEIAWQVQVLGVREIAVYDDNFSLDRARVLEICDQIVARGIRVHLQFTNGLRAENLDDEVLAALKRAGTWLIGVAPETGTERVMKLIGKKADLDRIREVVRGCRRVGIRTFAFFMIGFPGETDDEVAQTIAYARTLDTDMVQFARVIPFKGTRLFDQMDVRDHDHGREMGYFFETAANRALTGRVRRANRSFYLRPRKMLGLLRMHPPEDLLRLGWYSIITRSI
ncbi:MAG TPA: radical SAM protein [Myxococcota bacterium]|jgi:radical SAM superfamily enzyme YgiQ (UPF0313 family)|nr:radical SAM protein [Myxococcota bacterium]